MGKKSDIASVLKNIGWMVFDRLFFIFINLLVTVKIANFYGATEYGEYQYIVNVVALFEIIVTLIDGRVVKKKYSDYDAGEVVYNATLCRMIFSIAALALGCAYIYIGHAGKITTIMFFVLLMNSVVLDLRFGMQNRFEYLLKSRNIVIAADVASFIGVILQLAAVGSEKGIIYITFITLFSSLINLFLLYFQYRFYMKCRLIKKINFKLIKEMTKESLPLGIAASCATIYAKCDSVMLGTLSTSADVGIYSIATKMIGAIQIVLGPIRESIFPKMIKLYNEDYEKYKKLYIRITSIMTWLFVLGAIISFILLPFIIEAFLDTEYQQAYKVYIILTVGTFFMYNATLRSGHFTLMGQGRILMYSQLLSVFTNIILNILLIQFIGIYGAALATSITQGISLFLCNIFFKDSREVFFMQLRALNPCYLFKK